MKIKPLFLLIAGAVVIVLSTAGCAFIDRKSVV